MSNTIIPAEFTAAANRCHAAADRVREHYLGSTDELYAQAREDEAQAAQDAADALPSEGRLASTKRDWQRKADALKVRAANARAVAEMND